MSFEGFEEELRGSDEHIAAQNSEEASEPEPREYLIVQRRYFDAARQRAIRLLPHPSTFGNPKDYETHVLVRISQEAGMAFCNTKDAMGGQLAHTVEELAQRCVNAESGNSKKDSIIDELRNENADLRLDLAQVRGRAK